MIGASWSSLVLNAALLLAAAILVDLYVGSRLEAAHRWVSGLWIGVLSGAVVLIVMLTPLEVASGVVYDTRSVVLSLAARFFGAVPAAVAMAVAAIYRVAQGGAGVPAGIASILLSGGIGLLFRRFGRRPSRTISHLELVLLGLAATGSVVGSGLLFLPVDARQALLASAMLPVLVIFPLLTVATGRLLASRLHRLDEQQRLRASEERFRRLFESPRVVMLLVEPSSGAIIDANAAAANFYGWPHERLTALRVFDLDRNPPVDVDVWLSEAAEPTGTTFTTRNRLADGSERDVAVAIGPVTLGNRTSLYAIVTDISEHTAEEAHLRVENEAALAALEARTEQLARERTAAMRLRDEALTAQARAKQAQHASTEAARLVHAAQRAAGIGSWGFDPVTGNIELSDVAARILRRGSDLGPVAARWLLRHMPPATRSVALRWYRSVRGGAATATLRLQIDLGNGPRYLDVDGGRGMFREQHDLGTPTAARMTSPIVGTVRDVTELRSALDSVRKLSAAVEQGPLGIIITDVDGTIEFVNDAFVAISGYAHEEVLGRNPRILQSGRTSEGTYREMWSTLERGEVWRGEFINRKKDGTDYVESVIISPLVGPSGVTTNYVAVQQDVTEQRRREDELDDYRHRLEELVQKRTADADRARRIAEDPSHAKTEFLARMSHELRIPMNTIIGVTNLLNQDASASEKRHLETIQSASTQLLRLIDELLDLSRIESGGVELEQRPFAVHHVLSTMMSMADALTGTKDVELSLHTGAIPDVLVGDGDRLRQVLLNLFGNAIMFMERGSVRLRVETIDGSQDPPRLRFTVEDTGPGIPEHEVERLFEPFEPGRGQPQVAMGSGLGLAIAKRLVEAMGGRIDVASEPGQGSKFTVELPFETDTAT